MGTKGIFKRSEDGHGEFVKGVWVTAKSIPGRTFYFETYLPDYGALYDKLPISAFVSKPVTPKQIWIFTIFSFGIVWIMGWCLFTNNL